MSLLEKINSPEDLKNLSRKELPLLAAEIRELIVEVVSKSGGHLASSLGAVELAIALHYVFDTPHDKIVWDVGHQTYAHKIITGRREQFQSLRQYEGISGFTRKVLIVVSLLRATFSIEISIILSCIILVPVVSRSKITSGFLRLRFICI